MGRGVTGSSIVITLLGHVPSKKNSKQIFTSKTPTASGKFRKIVVPSQIHKLWHEEQMYRLARYRPNVPIEKCRIEINFYAPDKRNGDLSNKAESILDALVDARILKDDNWFVCDDVHLRLIAIDRENPRAQITIHLN